MRGHPLSAGVVPFRVSEGTVKFLILRSYNYWDFPKGEVEKSEKPFDTALRELQEEAGISEVSFPFGQAFMETPPYSHGKVARYYLGEVPSEEVVMGVNPDLGRPEHHEYRWVSSEEARKLLVPRLQDILNWALKEITV